MALLPTSVLDKEKGISFAMRVVEEAFVKGLQQINVESNSQDIEFCREVEHLLNEKFPIESIRGTREKLVVTFTPSQERVTHNNGVINLPEIIGTKNEIGYFILSKVDEAYKKGLPQLVVNGTEMQMNLCSNLGVVLYKRYPIKTLTWTKTRVSVIF